MKPSDFSATQPCDHESHPGGFLDSVRNALEALRHLTDFSAALDNAKQVSRDHLGNQADPQARCLLMRVEHARDLTRLMQLRPLIFEHIARTRCERDALAFLARFDSAVRRPRGGEH